jgi:hypothetical protein
MHINPSPTYKTVKILPQGAFALFTHPLNARNRGHRIIVFDFKELHDMQTHVFPLPQTVLVLTRKVQYHYQRIGFCFQKSS